jgi:hypothetical protein
MKARKVKGLDPDGPLADQLERIIRVRLDELHELAPAALATGDGHALHDVRIAAKRLRYLLEVSTFCFGAYAATAGRRARDLQDLLGEIHDCDVLLPRVLEQAAAVRDADAAALLARADGSPDLQPGMVATAPGRTSYRGLEVLAAYVQARRALLFGRFLRLWRTLEEEGFRPRLEVALAARPAAAAEDGAVVPPAGSG